MRKSPINVATTLTHFPYVRQLLGVVKGLEYLHSLDIPHGDLKGVGPSLCLCFDHHNRSVDVFPRFSIVLILRDRQMLSSTREGAPV